METAGQPQHGAIDEAGSVYEYAALSALALYGDFVIGSPSATLAIISEHPLPPEAKEALAASADRLGYGHDGCAWIVMRAMPSGGDASVLGDNDLKTIVESLDPVAVIATDSFSARSLCRSCGQKPMINDFGIIGGRRCVLLGDFPLMLKEDGEKQRAWRLMKRLMIG